MFFGGFFVLFFVCLFFIFAVNNYYFCVYYSTPYCRRSECSRAHTVQCILLRCENLNFKIVRSVRSFVRAAFRTHRTAAKDRRRTHGRTDGRKDGGHALELAACLCRIPFTSLPSLILHRVCHYFPAELVGRSAFLLTGG